MAKKAKRRTLQDRLDEFVSKQCVTTLGLDGRIISRRPLNSTEAMTTRQGFEAGYRAARADARREQKRKEKA